MADPTKAKYLPRGLLNRLPADRTDFNKDLAENSQDYVDYYLVTNPSHFSKLTEVEQRELLRYVNPEESAQLNGILKWVEKNEDRKVTVFEAILPAFAFVKREGSSPATSLPIQVPGRASTTTLKARTPSSGVGVKVHALPPSLSSSPKEGPASPLLFSNESDEKTEDSRIDGFGLGGTSSTAHVEPPSPRADGSGKSSGTAVSSSSRTKTITTVTEPTASRHIFVRYFEENKKSIKERILEQYINGKSFKTDSISVLIQLLPKDQLISLAVEDRNVALVIFNNPSLLLASLSKEARQEVLQEIYNRRCIPESRYSIPERRRVSREDDETKTSKEPPIHDLELAILAKEHGAVSKIPTLKEFCKNPPSLDIFFCNELEIKADKKAQPTGKTKSNAAYLYAGDPLTDWALKKHREAYVKSLKADQLMTTVAIATEFLNKGASHNQITADFCRILVKAQTSSKSVVREVIAQRLSDSELSNFLISLVRLGGRDKTSAQQEFAEKLVKAKAFHDFSPSRKAPTRVNIKTYGIVTRHICTTGGNAKGWWKQTKDAGNWFVSQIKLLANQWFTSDPKTRANEEMQAAYTDVRQAITTSSVIAGHLNLSQGQVLSLIDRNDVPDDICNSIITNSQYWKFCTLKADGQRRDNAALSSFLGKNPLFYMRFLGLQGETAETKLVEFIIKLVSEEKDISKDFQAFQTLFPKEKIALYLTEHKSLFEKVLASSATIPSRKYCAFFANNPIASWLIENEDVLKTVLTKPNLVSSATTPPVSYVKQFIVDLVYSLGDPSKLPAAFVSVNDGEVPPAWNINSLISHNVNTDKQHLQFAIDLGVHAPSFYSHVIPENNEDVLREAIKVLKSSSGRTSGEESYWKEVQQAALVLALFYEKNQRSVRDTMARIFLQGSITDSKVTPDQLRILVQRYPEFIGELVKEKPLLRKKLLEDEVACVAALTTLRSVPPEEIRAGTSISSSESPTASPPRITVGSHDASSSSSKEFKDSTSILSSTSETPRIREGSFIDFLKEEIKEQARKAWKKGNKILFGLLQDQLEKILDEPLSTLVPSSTGPGTPSLTSIIAGDEKRSVLPASSLSAETKDPLKIYIDAGFIRALLEYKEEEKTEEKSEDKPEPTFRDRVLVSDSRLIRLLKLGLDPWINLLAGALAVKSKTDPARLQQLFMSTDKDLQALARAAYRKDESLLSVSFPEIKEEEKRIIVHSQIRTLWLEGGRSVREKLSLQPSRIMNEVFDLNDCAEMAKAFSSPRVSSSSASSSLSSAVSPTMPASSGVAASSSSTSMLLSSDTRMAAVLREDKIGARTETHPEAGTVASARVADVVADIYRRVLLHNLKTTIEAESLAGPSVDFLSEIAQNSTYIVWLLSENTHQDQSDFRHSLFQKGFPFGFINLCLVGASNPNLQRELGRVLLAENTMRAGGQSRLTVICARCNESIQDFIVQACISHPEFLKDSSFKHLLSGDNKYYTELLIKLWDANNEEVKKILLTDNIIKSNKGACEHVLGVITRRLELANDRKYQPKTVIVFARSPVHSTSMSSGGGAKTAVPMAFGSAASSTSHTTSPGPAVSLGSSVSSATGTGSGPLVFRVKSGLTPAPQSPIDLDELENKLICELLQKDILSLLDPKEHPPAVSVSLPSSGSGDEAKEGKVEVAAVSAPSRQGDLKDYIQKTSFIANWFAADGDFRRQVLENDRWLSPLYEFSESGFRTILITSVSEQKPERIAALFQSSDEVLKDHLAVSVCRRKPEFLQNLLIIEVLRKPGNTRQLVELWDELCGLSKFLSDTINSDQQLAQLCEANNAIVIANIITAVAKNSDRLISLLMVEEPAALRHLALRALKQDISLLENKEIQTTLTASVGIDVWEALVTIMSEAPPVSLDVIISVLAGSREKTDELLDSESETLREMACDAYARHVGSSTGTLWFEALKQTGSENENKAKRLVTLWQHPKPGVRQTILKADLWNQNELARERLLSDNAWCLAEAKRLDEVKPALATPIKFTPSAKMDVTPQPGFRPTGSATATTSLSSPRVRIPFSSSIADDIGSSSSSDGGLNTSFFQTSTGLAFSPASAASPSPSLAISFKSPGSSSYLSQEDDINRNLLKDKLLKILVVMPVVEAKGETKGTEGKVDITEHPITTNFKRYVEKPVFLEKMLAYPAFSDELLKNAEYLLKLWLVVVSPSKEKVVTWIAKYPIKVAELLRHEKLPCRAIAWAAIHHQPALLEAPRPALSFSSTPTAAVSSESSVLRALQDAPVPVWAECGEMNEIVSKTLSTMTPGFKASGVISGFAKAVTPDKIVGFAQHSDATRNIVRLACKITDPTLILPLLREISNLELLRDFSAEILAVCTWVRTGNTPERAAQPDSVVEAVKKFLFLEIPGSRSDLSALAVAQGGLKDALKTTSISLLVAILKTCTPAELTAQVSLLHFIFTQYSEVSRLIAALDASIVRELLKAAPAGSEFEKVIFSTSLCLRLDPRDDLAKLTKPRQLLFLQSHAHDFCADEKGAPPELLAGFIALPYKEEKVVKDEAAPVVKVTIESTSISSQPVAVKVEPIKDEIKRTPDDPTQIQITNLLLANPDILGKLISAQVNITPYYGIIFNQFLRSESVTASRYLKKPAVIGLLQSFLVNRITEDPNAVLPIFFSNGIVRVLGLSSSLFELLGSGHLQIMVLTAASKLQGVEVLSTIFHEKNKGNSKIEDLKTLWKLDTLAQLLKTATPGFTGEVLTTYKDQFSLALFNGIEGSKVLAEVIKVNSVVLDKMVGDSSLAIQFIPTMMESCEFPLHRLQILLGYKDKVLTLAIARCSKINVKEVLTHKDTTLTDEQIQWLCEGGEGRSAIHLLDYPQIAARVVCTQSLCSEIKFTPIDLSAQLRHSSRDAFLSAWQQQREVMKVSAKDLDEKDVFYQLGTTVVDDLAHERNVENHLAILPYLSLRKDQYQGLLSLESKPCTLALARQRNAKELLEASAPMLTDQQIDWLFFAGQKDTGLSLHDFPKIRTRASTSKRFRDAIAAIPLPPSPTSSTASTSPRDRSPVAGSLGKGWAMVTPPKFENKDYDAKIRDAESEEKKAKAEELKTEIQAANVCRKDAWMLRSDEKFDKKKETTANNKEKEANGKEKALRKAYKKVEEPYREAYNIACNSKLSMSLVEQKEMRLKLVDLRSKAFKREDLLAEAKKAKDSADNRIRDADRITTKTDPKIRTFKQEAISLLQEATIWHEAAVTKLLATYLPAGQSVMPKAALSELGGLQKSLFNLERQLAEQMEAVSALQEAVVYYKAALLRVANMVGVETIPEATVETLKLRKKLASLHCQLGEVEPFILQVEKFGAADAEEFLKTILEAPLRGNEFATKLLQDVRVYSFPRGFIIRLTTLSPGPFREFETVGRELAKENKVVSQETRVRDALLQTYVKVGRSALTQLKTQLKDILDSIGKATVFLLLENAFALAPEQMKGDESSLAILLRQDDLSDYLEKRHIWDLGQKSEDAMKALLEVQYKLFTGEELLTLGKRLFRQNSEAETTQYFAKYKQDIVAKHSGLRVLIQEHSPKPEEKKPTSSTVSAASSGTQTTDKTGSPGVSGMDSATFEAFKQWKTEKDAKTTGSAAAAGSSSSKTADGTKVEVNPEEYAEFQRWKTQQSASTSSSSGTKTGETGAGGTEKVTQEEQTGSGSVPDAPPDAPPVSPWKRVLVLYPPNAIPDEKEEKASTIYLVCKHGRVLAHTFDEEKPKIKLLQSPFVLQVLSQAIPSFDPIAAETDTAHIFGNILSTLGPAEVTKASDKDTFEGIVSSYDNAEETTDWNRVLVLYPPNKIPEEEKELKAKTIYVVCKPGKMLATTFDKNGKPKIKIFKPALGLKMLPSSGSILVTEETYKETFENILSKHDEAKVATALEASPLERVIIVVYPNKIPVESKEQKANTIYIECRPGKILATTFDEKGKGTTKLLQETDIRGISTSATTPTEITEVKQQKQFTKILTSFSKAKVATSLDTTLLERVLVLPYPGKIPEGKEAGLTLYLIPKARKVNAVWYQDGKPRTSEFKRIEVDLSCFTGKASVEVTAETDTTELFGQALALCLTPAPVAAIDARKADMNAARIANQVQKLYKILDQLDAKGPSVAIPTTGKEGKEELKATEPAGTYSAEQLEKMIADGGFATETDLNMIIAVIAEVMSRFDFNYGKIPLEKYETTLEEKLLDLFAKKITSASDDEISADNKKKLNVLLTAEGSMIKLLSDATKEDQRLKKTLVTTPAGTLELRGKLGPSRGTVEKERIAVQPTFDKEKFFNVPFEGSKTCATRLNEIFIALDLREKDLSSILFDIKALASQFAGVNQDKPEDLLGKLTEKLDALIAKFNKGPSTEEKTKASKLEVAKEPVKECLVKAFTNYYASKTPIKAKGETKEVKEPTTPTATSSPTSATVLDASVLETQLRAYLHNKQKAKAESKSSVALVISKTPAKSSMSLLTLNQVCRCLDKVRILEDKTPSIDKLKSELASAGLASSGLPVAEVAEHLDTFTKAFLADYSMEPSDLQGVFSARFVEFSTKISSKISLPSILIIAVREFYIQDLRLSALIDSVDIDAITKHWKDLGLDSVEKNALGDSIIKFIHGFIRRHPTVSFTKFNLTEGSSAAYKVELKSEIEDKLLEMKAFTRLEEPGRSTKQNAVISTYREKIEKALITYYSRYNEPASIKTATSTSSSSSTSAMGKTVTSAAVSKVSSPSDRSSLLGQLSTATPLARLRKVGPPSERKLGSDTKILAALVGGDTEKDRNVVTEAVQLGSHGKGPLHHEPTAASSSSAAESAKKTVVKGSASGTATEEEKPAETPETPHVKAP